MFAVIDNGTMICLTTDREEAQQHFEFRRDAYKPLHQPNVKLYKLEEVSE